MQYESRPLLTLRASMVVAIYELPFRRNVCARLFPRLRDETDTAAIDAEVELMSNDRRDGQRTRLCGFDPVQKRFRTAPHQRGHRVGVEDLANH